MHPQDLVCPDTSFDPRTSTIRPQSQRHNHLYAPRYVPVRSIATSRPKRCPVSSNGCLLLGLIVGGRFGQRRMMPVIARGRPIGVYPLRRANGDNLSNGLGTTTKKWGCYGHSFSVLRSIARGSGSRALRVADDFVFGAHVADLLACAGNFMFLFPSEACCESDSQTIFTRAGLLVSMVHCVLWLSWIA